MGWELLWFLHLQLIPHLPPGWPRTFDLDRSRINLRQPVWPLKSQNQKRHGLRAARIPCNCTFSSRLPTYFFSYSPMYRATAGFILISLSISPTSTSTNCRLQPTVTKEYFSSVYNSVLSYLTSFLLLFQAQYIMYSAVHGPRHGSVSIGSPALNFPNSWVIHPMHSIMIYYRCSKRTGRISNCSLGIKSVGQMNHNLGAQEETCWAAKRKIDHLHIIIQHHYVYAMFATPWKMHTNTITYGASVQLTYFLFMLLNVCVIKFVFQQLFALFTYCRADFNTASITYFG